MFFSKDIDLGASKSRAIIDAVRCVEVFCGEPLEVLSIKAGRPFVHKKLPDAMVHIGIEVLTRKGLFTLALRLEGKKMVPGVLKVDG